jgi:hypothetical protein
MAEAYKKAKLVTTAGATGGFVGFYTPSAQTITLTGPFIYGTGGSTAAPLAMSFPANATVPINCYGITPGTASIIAFLA